MFKLVENSEDEIKVTKIAKVMTLNAVVCIAVSFKNEAIRIIG